MLLIKNKQALRYLNEIIYLQQKIRNIKLKKTEVVLQALQNYYIDLLKEILQNDLLIRILERVEYELDNNANEINYFKILCEEIDEFSSEIHQYLSTFDIIRYLDDIFLHEIDISKNKLKIKEIKRKIREAKKEIRKS